MAKIPYSYNGEEPFIRDNKNKSIRFLLLIILVSIITCAIIWFILPKDKRESIIKKISPTIAQKSTSKENVSTDNSISNQSNNSEKDITKQVDNKQTTPSITTPIDVKTQVADKSDDKNIPSTSTNNIQSSNNSEDTLDDKGIVTKKDLPKEADKPELLPFTVSDSLKEKLALATSHQRNSNYQDANSIAKELLAIAPISSDFGRKAAYILTESNWLRFAIGGPIDNHSVTHVVKSGDSLSKLALKYKTTIDAIRLSNALKSDIVKLGQKLTIYPGPWEIIISKKSRQLILRHGTTKELFFIFDVGIGRMNSTPKATFKVIGRIRHPQWRTSDGRIYPYGSPENQLGKYFIKLAPTGDSSPSLVGYGIHGTPDESSVQRSLSRGCVRMRNNEIERLFTAVPYNSAVVITD